MKFVKVKYSKGSLGKNIGTENAPDLLVEIGEEINYKGNVDELMKKIENTEGDFFIGGDHSITYGSFKGFAKKYKNPGIMIFDAHPDLEVGTSSVTHEDYLRRLVEENVLKKQNIVLVGIREVSKNEKEFMKGIHVFFMENIFRNEEEICDSVMELSRPFDGLYLSIDIDVLDPAFAPGTGYLEPGGMDLQQLLYFLKRIKNMKNLKRMDLVEINPKKDIKDMTVKTGEKIINTLMFSK